MSTLGRVHPMGYSRRQAIGLLATGAGLTLGSACRSGPSPDVAAGDSATSDAQAVAFPDGAIVRTILDDVPPDSLAGGATLFHEHLQLGFGYYTSPPAMGSGQGGGTAPSEANTERFLHLVVEELRMAATDGMSCVVDAAIGRRSEREIENLRQMATRSGMPVVVAGGYFRAPYPNALVEMTVDQMAAHLAEDAQAQRWGALGEIGTSLEMHPDERRFLQAVSRCHLSTGLPIFSHTDHEGCASCALEQLDIFESEGVDPAHLCIGHLSDITLEEDADSQTHKAIAERGAFVGFDTVGRALGMAPQGAPGKLPPSHEDIPEAVKVRRVVSVLDAGYEDHVLLSADFSSALDLKANWGNGFSTTLVQFIPKLRHAGVDEQTLHKILVDNPRRFLAYVPPSSVV